MLQNYHTMFNSSVGMIPAFKICVRHIFGRVTCFALHRFELGLGDSCDEQFAYPNSNQFQFKSRECLSQNYHVR